MGKLHNFNFSEAFLPNFLKIGILVVLMLKTIFENLKEFHRKNFTESRFFWFKVLIRTLTTLP